MPEYTVLSAPGLGGISMIALKGGRSAFETVFAGKRHSEGAGQQLVFGNLINADNKQVDEALLAIDGENAELTVHGGPAVLEQTIEILEKAGFNKTKTGSLFSRSPFYNDTIHALKQLHGIAGAHMFLQCIDNYITDSIKHICGCIRSNDIAEARQAASVLCADWALRNGYINPPVLMLVGRENAGKSTLFNAIVGFERVVVTNIPGTTVDYVDETIVYRDYPFVLVDTAGFSENDSLDPELYPARVSGYILVTACGESSVLSRNLLPAGQAPVIHVFSKTDLSDQTHEDDNAHVYISAHTGEGIDRVLDMMYNTFAGDQGIKPGLFLPHQIERVEKALALMDQGASEKAAGILEEYFFET